MSLPFNKDQGLVGSREPASFCRRGRVMTRLRLVPLRAGAEHLLSALHKGLIHVPGVVAHDLGELIPPRLLGRDDTQLCVQLFVQANYPQRRTAFETHSGA